MVVEVVVVVVMVSGQSFRAEVVVLLVALRLPVLLQASVGVVGWVVQAALGVVGWVVQAALGVVGWVVQASSVGVVG